MSACVTKPHPLNRRQSEKKKKRYEADGAATEEMSAGCQRCLHRLNHSPTHWLTDCLAVALFALSVTLFSQEEWGFGAFSIDEIFHKFDSRLPYNIHFQIFFFYRGLKCIKLDYLLYKEKKLVATCTFEKE